MSVDAPTRSELDSKRDALLTLLLDGRAHSQQECVEAGGMRYGGRLFELRKLGHSVLTVRDPENGRRFLYQLVEASIVREPEQGVLI